MTRMQRFATRLQLQVALADGDEAADAQRFHGADLARRNQHTAGGAQPRQERTQWSSMVAWLVPGVKSE